MAQQIKITDFHATASTGHKSEYIMEQQLQIKTHSRVKLVLLMQDKISLASF